MDNNLFEQIKQFVVDARWKYDFPLTFETTLEGDLQITGDDSDEFIIAFGKKFNIDVSNFDLAAYFGGEGGLWGLTWTLPTPGKIPITLGDLYNAVLTGTMHETDSFKQILQFVRDERWGFAEPFVRKTELYRHLKLWGDDAYEFIVAFGQKFNVDISEFDFDEYFYQKENKILATILDFLLIKKKPKITLEDLEKAVAIGKLG